MDTSDLSRTSSGSARANLKRTFLRTTACVTLLFFLHAELARAAEIPLSWLAAGPADPETPVSLSGITLSSGTVSAPPTTTSFLMESGALSAAQSLEDAAVIPEATIRAVSKVLQTYPNGKVQKDRTQYKTAGGLLLRQIVRNFRATGVIESSTETFYRDGAKYSTTVKTYDKNGLLTKTAHSIEGPLGLEQKEIFYFNAQGKVTKVDAFDYSGGALEEKTQFLAQKNEPIKRFGASGLLLETLATGAIDRSRVPGGTWIDFTNGIRGYYLEKEPVEFETADGSRITAIAIDPEGVLQDATLLLPDGSAEILRGQKIVRRIFPDGRVQDFTPGGTLIRETFDKKTVFYELQWDAPQQVFQTTAHVSDGTKTVYDAEGALKEISAAHERFVYRREKTETGTRILLDRPVSSAPQAKTPVKAGYALSGEMLYAELSDGTRIEFENGQPKRVTDADGGLKTIEVSEGLLWVLHPAGVSGDPAWLAYDRNGIARVLGGAEGAVIREGIAGEEISVADAAGNVLRNLRLDENGSLSSGTIEGPEGFRRIFEDGVLRRLETPDGKNYAVADGKAVLESWQSDWEHFFFGAQALERLAYPSSKNIAVIEDPGTGSFEFARREAEGTYFYDRSGNLQRLERSAGGRIDYDRQGRAVSMTDPKGTRYEITYEDDAAGSPAAVHFRSGKDEYVFDPGGDLQKMTQNGAHYFFEDGALSEIATHFGRIFSPAWDEAGRITAGILLADGTELKVAGGELLEKTLPGGAKIFLEGGKIARVLIADRAYEIVDRGPEAASPGSRFLIRFEEEGEARETDLVDYLLARPDSALAGIFSFKAAEAFPEEPWELWAHLPRLAPLYAERYKSAESVGSREWFLLGKTVTDPEKGEVDELGGWIEPGISNVESDLSGRALSETRSLDGEKVLVTDLLDMNGDRLPDRVLFDPVTRTWRVQINGFSSFGDPAIWSGVESSAGPEAAYGYALRHYQTSLNNILSDLRDMTGDGLPDRIFADPGHENVWYIQVNTGSGFEKARVWAENVHPVSQEHTDHRYALRVRDEDGSLVADLLDLDGDGLPDRVIRPKKEAGQAVDHWFFQKNTGTGFADAVIWDGVDSSFESDPARAGALSFSDTVAGRWIFVRSGLEDMNGDGRPDRVLVKNEIDIRGACPGNCMPYRDWYVQWNHGDGFDPPVLWKHGAPQGIHIYDTAYPSVNLLETLQDVSGDRMADEIGGQSLLGNFQYYDLPGQNDRPWGALINNGQPFNNRQQSWLIASGELAASVVGQDERDYFTLEGHEEMTRLIDMNGDGIADRVIHDRATGKWTLQFGDSAFSTAQHFTPAETLRVSAYGADLGPTRSSDYDFIRLSLKGDPDAAGSAGVAVSLYDPGQGTLGQSWALGTPSAEWQNYDLAIDPEKPSRSFLSVEYQDPAGTSQDRFLIGGVSFVSFSASPEDWKNYLEPEVLRPVVASQAADLMRGTAGLLTKSFKTAFDPEKVLDLAKEISWTEAGEIRTVETLRGESLTLANGRVLSSAMKDGSSASFSGASADGANVVEWASLSGATERVEFSGGKVIRVTGPEAILDYAYERDEMGREVTVIRDQETGGVEKYTAGRLTRRIQPNGVETVFEYDLRGELVISRVLYKGRERQIFSHAVGEEGSVITAGDGSREEYSADGRLLFHVTADGWRYAHTRGQAKKIETVENEIVEILPDGTSVRVVVPRITLADDPGGEEIEIVTLAGRETHDGRYASYHNGVLESVELADGTLISFDAWGAGGASAEDPSSRKPSEVTIFYPEGVVMEWRDGEAQRIGFSNGETILFDRTRPQTASETFFLARAREIWEPVVLKNASEFLLPDTALIQSEFSSDGTVQTRTYTGGTVELYRADGKVEQIVGRGGERLVRFYYDENGDPVGIDMEGSRRRLHSASLQLKAEVNVANEEALARVAEREQVLGETFEGEYLVYRDKLLAMRARVEAERANVEAMGGSGKAVRSAKSDAFGQLQGALDQVNAALARLAEERAAALERLSASVEHARREIESQKTQAYGEIAREEEKARQAILRQETLPVIDHWYRKILGRDPSEAEYLRWVPESGNGAIALEALKMELLSGEEYAARSAETGAIKNALEAALTEYAGFSEEGKKAFAAALGIEEEYRVELSGSEIAQILEWIRRQSLHFGQSAFIALESLLDAAGVPYSRTELAVQVILIDILTGTITSFEPGDLVLSLYAMGRVAALYGVGTQALRMSEKGLLELLRERCPAGQALCEPGLVAHVGGNHYVILTGSERVARVDGEGKPVISADGEPVMEEWITYVDPGMGPEGSPETVRISQEDFRALWLQRGADGGAYGHILSSVPVPGTILAEEGRVLDTREAMEVRGAFFGIIAVVAAAIVAAVVAAVASVVAAVTAIVGGLVAGIGAILSGFGAFFTGLLSGQFLVGLQALFSGVLTGLGAIAEGIVGGLWSLGAGLFQAFNALHHGIFSVIDGFIGSGFFGAGVQGLGASPVISGMAQVGLIGLEIDGTGQFLEAVGASPKFARTVSAAGKVLAGVGLAASGNPLGLSASLGLMAAGSAELLELHTDLSSGMVHILSTGMAAAGLFSGGVLQGSSLQAGMNALRSGLPFLSAEFASAGMTAFGGAVGMDPFFTGLLDAPVRMSASALVQRLDTQVRNAAVRGAFESVQKTALDRKPDVEYLLDRQGSAEMKVPGIVFFAPGIHSPGPEGSLPSYAENFVEEFAKRGIKVEPIPLFEGTSILTGAAEVVLEMLIAAPMEKDKIKAAIVSYVEEHPLAEGQKIDLVLYSGSGQAGLEAADELGREYGLEFGKIILLDAPVFVNSPLRNIGEVHLIQGDLSDHPSESGLPLGWLVFPLLPQPEGGVDFKNVIGASKLSRSRIEGFGHLDFSREENIAAVVMEIIKILKDES
ncbi:MAG: hypothetical protein ACOY3K_03310 [Candidatus Omnitrophota bacterium]